MSETDSSSAEPLSRISIDTDAEPMPWLLVVLPAPFVAEPLAAAAVVGAVDPLSNGPPCCCCIRQPRTCGPIKARFAVIAMLIEARCWNGTVSHRGHCDEPSRRFHHRWRRFSKEKWPPFKRVIDRLKVLFIETLSTFFSFALGTAIIRTPPARGAVFGVPVFDFSYFSRPPDMGLNWPDCWTFRWPVTNQGPRRQVSQKRQKKSPKLKRASCSDDEP